jgi:hypothetical protein
MMIAQDLLTRVRSARASWPAAFEQHGAPVEDGALVELPAPDCSRDEDVLSPGASTAQGKGVGPLQRLG